MSVIFYKFKIAKDSFDSAKFDGSGLSVWDLKREIIVAKKLGKGADFDLVLLNPQTNEEYDDDAFVVPKNTTVTVVRRPAQRAGRGSAQRYLGHNPTGGMGGGMGPGGGGAMGRRGMQQHHQQLQFQRMQQRHQEAASTGTATQPLAVSEGMTEEEKINVMFKQQASQWESTQDQMMSQRPVYRPGAGRGGGFMGRGGGGMPGRPFEEKKPHEGYICFRCGEKGHYINMCPTMGNADFDNRPKLKKTTGIPKMFLKAVETRDAAGMVTETGELVVAQPNEEAFLKMTARGRVNEDAFSKDTVPSEFKCSLCDKTLNDPVSVSCCQRNFCRDCITYSILENPDVSMRFKCPSCKRGQTLEGLRSNPGLRNAIARQSQGGVKQAESDGISPGDRGSLSSLQVKDSHVNNGSLEQDTIPADREGSSRTSLKRESPASEAIRPVKQHRPQPDT